MFHIYFQKYGRNSNTIDILRYCIPYKWYILNKTDILYYNQNFITGLKNIIFEIHQNIEILSISLSLHLFLTVFLLYTK
jgi:hypothetical protein